MDSLPAVLAGEDLLHLRVLWADRFVVGTNWDTRDVCSSYWRFYVNSRDGASLLTDAGRYPLRGGLIHFVPAWVRFTCHNTTDLDHLFVHFDPIGLPGALVRELFPSPRSLTPDADLVRACRRLGDDLHER
ncbi:MAG: hypothetical protein H0W72_17850, partial [Planctomycetes bacterium]|nr:hypothetical protein [Planctomycetota bacterium]